MKKTFKQKYFKYLVAFLIMLVAGSVSITETKAARLPSSPDNYYYDETNLLDSTTEELVTNKNRIYQKTKQQPQVVMAVVKSTGDDDIDEYAPELFKKWQIGQRNEDNGVLILYANNKGRRNVRIEVGYGLEGALTDSEAGQILTANASLLKSTDKAKVNEGLQKTFNAVATLIDKEYGFKGDKNSLTDKELNEIRRPHQVDLPYAIIVGFIVFAVLAYFGSKNNHGGRGGGSNYGGGSGFPWWLLLGSGSSSRSFGDDDDDDFFGGFGGFGGGGGFSGGGGSSGGGGASI